MAGTATLLPVARERTRWGQNIHRLMDAAGVTSTAVAAKAGMTIGQFSDVVNNLEQNPKVKTLQRIADALGVDVAVLFASGSTPQEAPPHARRAASVAPIDPATLAPVIREALALVLMDCIRTLSPQDEPTHESPSGARAHETDDGALSVKAG